MDPGTAVFIASAAIDVGVATYAHIKKSTADAAVSVAKIVAKDLAPDYAAMTLDDVANSSKGLIDAAHDDLARKLAPANSETYKRRGNATWGYLEPKLKANKVPAYEYYRLKTAIYNRFGNSQMAKKATNAASLYKKSYKGFFVSGKLDHPSVKEPTVDEPKQKGQQQILLGVGALLVAALVLGGKKDADVSPPVSE